MKITFISDQKNDPCGIKGDIYTLIDDIRAYTVYEHEYLKGTTLRELTGLMPYEIIGIPFMIVDNRCYLLKEWADTDYNNYTVLNSAIVS